MSPRNLKKPRILVVEDDTVVRGLEVFTLEQAGYEVVEVATGEEALERLRKRSFDLVILDIMMPGIDGYEVLEQIRVMPTRAHTPVIIVTAKGREQSGMIREAGGGVDDHIDKPFQPSTLESAVATVLAKSRKELAAHRNVQSRAARVYEAVLQLRASGATGEEPEIRLGPLRRSRR